MTESTYSNRGKWSVLWVLILIVCILIIPAVSLASASISLKMGNVSAEPGTEIKVPISIESNTGIASLKFKVKYDDTLLTLKDVTFPKNSSTYTSVPEPYSAEQTINFVSPLSSFNKTGTFATLTFLVDENATLNQLSEVELEYEDEDIFDIDFNDVQIVISKGSIHISDQNGQGSMTVLPQSMTVITEESFMNTSFYYVVLPETTTTIESKAFADCENLKYIYIPNKTDTIADDAFLNVTGLTIYSKNGSTAELFANKKGYKFESR